MTLSLKQKCILLLFIEFDYFKLDDLISNQTKQI